MIFESKKSYESGQAQFLAQLWEAIRTRVECARMYNETGAQIDRSRIVDLDMGSATPRSIVLVNAATSIEQFGVAEQPIANLSFGIVRKRNIVRCKMEDNMAVAPNVGDKVYVSAAENGAGTVTLPLPFGSAPVGTITDVTGFNAATYPYVLLLLRRCTASLNPN